MSTANLKNQMEFFKNPKNKGQKGDIVTDMATEVVKELPEEMARKPFV